MPPSSALNQPIKSLNGAYQDKVVVGIAYVREDGSLCTLNSVNIAGQEDLIPSFMNTAHPEDLEKLEMNQNIDETLSQFPICESNDIIALQNIAEFAVEGPAQSTAVGTIVNAAIPIMKWVVGSTFSGCAIGAGVGSTVSGLSSGKDAIIALGGGYDYRREHEKLEREGFFHQLDKMGLTIATSTTGYMSGTIVGKGSLKVASDIYQAANSPSLKIRATAAQALSLWGITEGFLNCSEETYYFLKNYKESEKKRNKEKK